MPAVQTTHSYECLICVVWLCQTITFLSCMCVQCGWLPKYNKLTLCVGLNVQMEGQFVNQHMYTDAIYH